jgi:hypothetical protein
MPRTSLGGRDDRRSVVNVEYREQRRRRDHHAAADAEDRDAQLVAAGELIGDAAGDAQY